MKKYDFDQIIDRSGTNCVKCLGVAEDAIPMSIADMDFACADPILEALHNRVDRKIFGYSTFRVPSYQEAVTGWFKKHYDWDVDAENVFFSAGVVPAFSGLIELLSEKGEGVIIQEPVYNPFRMVIEKNNRTVFNAPLKQVDGDYVMDYEALEEAMANPKTRMFILCSPHNPVGRVWTEQELRRVVDIAKKYDKWIISDEIHCDIRRKGVVHTPLAKVCPDYLDRIVVCTAPSKTFNLAGLQVSNIVIYNKELQAGWSNLIYDAWGHWQPNTFAVDAATAAYTQCEDWMEQMLEYVDGNIDFACDYIRENLPKARIKKPEGTYMIWLDLNGYERDPKKLEEIMVNKAKLVLDEGYVFGEGGSGFERINLACPRSVVKTALERLKNALETN